MSDIDELDLDELFGPDDDVGDPTGPEVIRRPTRPTTTQPSAAGVEGEDLAVLVEAAGDDDDDAEAVATPDIGLDGNDLMTDNLHADLVADDPDVRDSAPKATPDADAADDEAQHATLDALEGVLVDLRDQLTRTTAWVDEALAGIEVARGDG